MILPSQSAGPQNLAVGAAVSASTGAPGAAVDGNLDTRWDSGKNSTGAYYPTAAYQVDLGSAKQISRVNLVWEGAYAKAFTVQASTDGTTWTQVYATTTGTGGNSQISFAQRAAR